MGNRNYLAGRRFEYETMAHLGKRGYVCTRGAGSHGWDIVAVHDSGERPIDLIECKVVTKESQAHRLLEQFKTNPPMMPSKYYHQVMFVKVKGKIVLEVTV